MGGGGSAARYQQGRRQLPATAAGTGGGGGIGDKGVFSYHRGASRSPPTNALLFGGAGSGSSSLSPAMVMHCSPMFVRLECAHDSRNKCHVDKVGSSRRHVFSGDGGRGGDGNCSTDDVGLLCSSSRGCGSGSDGGGSDAQQSSPPSPLQQRQKQKLEREGSVVDARHSLSRALKAYSPPEIAITWVNGLAIQSGSGMSGPQTYLHICATTIPKADKAATMGVKRGGEFSGNFVEGGQEAVAFDTDGSRNAGGGGFIPENNAVTYPTSGSSSSPPVKVCLPACAPCSIFLSLW